MSITRHSAREHRKLAVMMFTDIVGFSAMAEDNEARSLELLAEHASILRPLFAAFDGVEVKTIGDAFLVEFSSAVLAAECAIEIQNRLHSRNKVCGAERRLELRIGLHLGDIVRTGSDVLGDGVNIASRIQELADPSGVCISQQVFDQVRGKLDIPFLELRSPTLKNLEAPIRVYAMRFAWTGKPRTWAERLADGVRFRIGHFRIVITMMAAAFLILTTGALLELLRRQSAGVQFTISKPEGGTIVGPGIECGTSGTRCSTAMGPGELVELEPRPDEGYVFSGFTGDCSPAGRTAMTGSRTCGARFDRVVTSAQTTTFRLTINKPEGGTIVGAGGILCGVNGSTCTADIPSGLPVSLKAEAAEGFSLDQFTGECPSTGEMQMTGPKTCGAMFIKSSAAMNPGTGQRSVAVPSVSRATPPPVVAAPPPATQNPPPTPTSHGEGLTSVPASPTTQPAPDKPAAAPINAEEHAKQEINQLVKNYCAALGTLQAATIRRLFHRDIAQEIRGRYDGYKSLKCSITSPPEYIRLDAGPAGGAQLTFTMKQIVESRAGGAPKTLEEKTTLVVSRKNFTSPWLIDRVVTNAQF